MSLAGMADEFLFEILIQLAKLGCCCIFLFLLLFLQFFFVLFLLAYSWIQM